MKHSISFAELCPADSHEFAEQLLYAVNVIASRAATDGLTISVGDSISVYCHCSAAGIDFSAEPLEAEPSAPPLLRLRRPNTARVEIQLEHALPPEVYKLWIRDLRDALIDAELQQALPLPPAVCDELRWRHLCQRVDNLQTICTLTPPVRVAYRTALWLPPDATGHRYTTDDWDAADEGEIWAEEPFLRWLGRNGANDIPRLLDASSIDRKTAQQLENYRMRTDLVFPLAR